MKLRSLAIIALAASSLAACGGSEPGGGGGKKSLASINGLKDYPAVQAIETGGAEDAYSVSLNLELGSYKVSHGETLDHLATAEGTCSDEELAGGRELFTQDAVDEYEANAASGGERKLQFTVIWPDGSPKTMTVFSLDPTDPPSALESATTYTRRYIELYAPPAPTTEPADAGCPDGDLCPDVPAE